MLPTLPGLRPVARLGLGGAAEVWLCEEEALGRRVAVKVGHPETRPEALLDEARLLSGVVHENLVRVLRVGMVGDGRFFLVSEFVEGGSLAQCLERRQAVGEPEALALVRGIGRGLAAAAAAGVLHRDLKPSNVFLERGGSPKVGDFGLGRRAGAAIPLPGEGIVGTLAYVPPERLNGFAEDLRGDLYSLGILLFELLTGRLPFAGVEDATAIAQLHLSGKLESLPRTVSPPTRGLYLHLTALRVHRRPKSYRAVLDRIDESLDGQLPAGPAPGLTQRIRVLLRDGLGR